MRSVAFFLAVFFSLVLILYLVVDHAEVVPPAASNAREAVPDASSRGIAGGPATSASPAAESRGEEKGNFIDVPIYDAQKGRLAYRLSGYLNKDVFQNIEMPDLNQASIHDGEIEIPIYDDQTRELPSVDQKKANQFRIRFAVAEYQKLETRSLVKKQEVIRLSRGGQIFADDGSLIHFEDLQVTIHRDPNTKPFYTFQSAKPITFQNNLFIMEGPSGLDGKIQDDKEITIKPPVYTYFDAKVAQLFAIKAPPAQGAEKSPAIPALARAAGVGPRKDAGAAAGKVAVTSQGPLVLALSKQKHTVEFLKDVQIFPVDKLIPGQPASPQDTWFHAQKLAVKIEDGPGPPVLKEAVATWEGGRVKAYHKGYLADGDVLTWKNLGKDPAAPAAAGSAAAGSAAAGSSTAGSTEGAPEEGTPAFRSETLLTGRPSLSHEGKVRLHGDRAVFHLAENRAVLIGNVEGVFWLDPEVVKRRTSSKDASGAAGDIKPAVHQDGAGESAGAQPSSRKETEDLLPRLWKFKADEAEITLAKNFTDHPKDAVLAFVARSTTGEDLTVNSLKSNDPQSEASPEDFRLRGKKLHYDGETRSILVEGAEAGAAAAGPATGPEFTFGKCKGTAEKILFKEDFLRLDRSVDILLHQEDMQLLEKKDAAGKTSSPGLPADSSLHVNCDQLDMRFDPKGGLNTMVCRSLGEKPVVLKPEGAGLAYILQGPGLTWDHKNQLAILESADGSGQASGTDPGRLRPELRFDEGRLSAKKIRFEKKRWTAILEGGLEIQADLPEKDSRKPSFDAPGPPAGAPGSGAPANPDDGRPLIIRAERGEVEFFEEFAPLAEADPAAGKSNPGAASPSAPPPAGKAAGGSLKELRRIRSIRVSGAKDRNIEIESRSFTASAHEAGWESAARELKLFGEGKQVFRSSENPQDALEAELIVYKRGEGLIELRRDVVGWIRQAQPAALAGSQAQKTSQPSASGAGKAPPPADSILWKFSTHALDARIVENPQGKDLRSSLISLSAHENVSLTAEAHGVTLHGDDMEYDRDEQKIRIYSRVGRSQTLTRSLTVSAPNEEPIVKTDKIDAREINLWYLQVPNFARPGAPSDHQVVVEFKQEVSAAFHVPRKSASFLPGDKTKDPSKDDLLCKLQSAVLALRLMPGREQDKLVEMAHAIGNVDFLLGDKRAMAHEAIFEEDLERLTLRGDGKQNVRLFNGEKSFEGPEFVLSQLGSNIRLDRKDRLGPPPPPLLPPAPGGGVR